MIIFVTLLVLFSSFSASACMFPPEGMIESHHSQFNKLALVSIFIAACVLLVRFIHQKSCLWVPSILVLAWSGISFGLLYLESLGVIGNGGACGRPGMVFLGQIWLGGNMMILVFEMIKYRKHGKAEKNCR